MGTLPIFAAVVASTLNSFFPGPSGFLCLFTGVAVVLFWLLAAVLKLGIDLCRGQWMSLGRRSIVIATSAPLVGFAFLSGDYLHLFALYPYYMPKIAAAPEEVVRFAWGDDAVTVLDGIQLRVLVHDGSGMTKAAVGVERPGPEGLEGLRVNTSHLIGDFFLETTSSP
jgi:hypothetical protein